MHILGYTVSVLWASLILFFWIMIAFWPASIAKQKGYSFLGFFALSIFFWWITLFVVMFLEDKNKPAAPKAD